MEGLCTIMTKIHSSHCQRRCLQYLVQYGGDLKKCTYQNQETTRDIAVRRGKTAVVTVIDEYCKMLVTVVVVVVVVVVVIVVVSIVVVVVIVVVIAVVLLLLLYWPLCL